MHGHTIYKTDKIKCRSENIGIIIKSATLIDLITIIIIFAQIYELWLAFIAGLVNIKKKVGMYP